MENEIIGPVEQSVSVDKPRKKAFRIVRGILVFLLLCILLIGIWVGICWLQKVPTRSVIPSDYSVFLHTDSAYKTFDPLLDLKVTDMFLSSPELRGAKSAVNELRNSDLRNKNSFKKITSRKMDIAFYSDDEGLMNFVAAVDMGPYACLGRITPLLLKFLKSGPLKDVEYIKDDSFLPYYQIKNDGSYIYFKPYKNLIIASSSMKLFTRALLNSPFSDSYTEEEELAFSKDEDSLNLIVKPRVLFRALTARNIITQEIDAILSDSIPATFSVDVDDSKIDVGIKLPIDFDKENHFSNLITRKSTVPDFGLKLNDEITACTLLNIGTLSDLKDAMFPLFSTSESMETLWSSAQKVCKVLVGLTLDDMLFSWSGQEIAVLGVKGCVESVFAVKVDDEVERDRVFKKLSASLFVKNEVSVNRSGAKLNHLMLPSLVDKLLSAFKISLPSPYYFVQDGFLYLSQSPSALNSLYVTDGSDSGVEDGVWSKLEDSAGQPSSISVYYDLDRKAPFFLKGDGSFVEALSFYRSGHCNIAFDSDGMSINLYACR